MLTDWERNQLAEIERGLAADFALRRRLRHLIASIGPWGPAGTALALGCLVMSGVIGAWWSVAGLAAALSLCAMGGKRRLRLRLRRRGRY